MIVVTITIGLVACALGYIAYDNNKKALNAKIKFENLKEFADKSGKRILELEKDKASLANEVVLLQSRVEMIGLSEKNLQPIAKPQTGTGSKKKYFKPRPNKGLDKK